MATGPYFTQGLKFNAVLIISGALILFILSRTLSISLKNNEGYQKDLRNKIANTSSSIIEDTISKKNPSSPFQNRRETFYCNKESVKTDLCYISGDVRVNASGNMVILYAINNSTARGVETIKPYPRKWEKEMMESSVGDIVIKSTDVPEALIPWSPNDDIDAMNETRIAETIRSVHGDVRINSTLWFEAAWKLDRSRPLPKNWTQLDFLEEERRLLEKLSLSSGGTLGNRWGREWIVFNISSPVSEDYLKNENPVLNCDVKHKVPGVLFSLGGYTGNLFHDFNDGIVPLYVSTRRFKGEFVVLLEDPKFWWIVRYAPLLRQISNYPLVLLGKERWVHCFPELFIGLETHGNLKVNSTLISGGHGSLQDLQDKMHLAWGDLEENIYPICKPIIFFVSRSRTRAITNEKEIVSLAEDLGFFVHFYIPAMDVPIQWMWKHIQKADVLIGVHGAALTQFLFLKPNASFMQVIPFGVEVLSEMYFGFPSIDFGLQYLEYRVSERESSLSLIYPRNHTVFKDPYHIWEVKGWEASQIFMGQNVTLDMERVKKSLLQIKGQLQYNPSYLSRIKTCKK